MDDEAPVQEGQPTGPESTVAVPAAPAEVVDRRMARILDFINDSLARKDATLANLGAINGDLMLFAYQLKKAILERMGDRPTWEDFEELMPLIELYNKLVKQIERNVKVEAKLDGHRLNGLPDLTV